MAESGNVDCSLGMLAIFEAPARQPQVHRGVQTLYLRRVIRMPPECPA